MARARSIAGAITVAFALTARAGAAAPEPCAGSREVAIVTSPREPAPGGPLRILAAVEQPVAATLVVRGPDGERIAETAERRGGPPFWWSAELTSARAGRYRVELAAGGETLGCDEVEVADRAARAPTGAATWPILRQWDRASENLYAAWVEKLFDAPPGSEPSWHALHDVTRDPGRNVLYDHLGLGEDGPQGLRLEPDCADLPYFLRAYFAWKLGLPFGWSECGRGGDGHPPRCTRWHSNLDAVAGGGNALARMQRFFARDVAWGVQSGAGRAPAEDDRTDFYPTRLADETLRPGTVYADPYGHTLVLVRRVPQTTSSPGLLLAVDAQPDGTVARKRYWRGNFLFALDPSLGSAGFKHFRPVVRAGRGLRTLTNREILGHPDWGDYSLEQYRSDVDSFYDRVDELLSPTPLDAGVVFRAALDALDEQVRTRVGAVANGEAFLAAHPGTIPMPEGAAIFETTGPWEDYATPSRDLRLLIAIDVVRGFPEKAARRPERFAPRPGRSPAELASELEAILRDEAAVRHFEYIRSDGSPWTLTLGDVLARTEAFEVAYDPNDCIEVRWGASPGSTEMATCRRRAPADQAARLTRYRAWFHERSRPPR